MGLTSEGHVYANEIILIIISHAIRSTPNLTNVVSLSRCDATCFPRGVADWLKQSADSIKIKLMLSG